MCYLAISLRVNTHYMDNRKKTNINKYTEIILKKGQVSHLVQIYNKFSVTKDRRLLEKIFVRKPCHIQFIDMVSPLCVVSDVVIDYYYLINLYYRQYIDMDSPPCVFFDVVIDHYYVRKPYHRQCIDMFSSLCVSFYVVLDHYYLRKPCHIQCIDMVSLLCVFSDIVIDH